CVKTIQKRQRIIPVFTFCNRFECGWRGGGQNLPSVLVAGTSRLITFLKKQISSEIVLIGRNQTAIRPNRSIN
ncbi:MAG: hypothetical protein V4805_11605, partial [Pseudomonadota bacterium]